MTAIDHFPHLHIRPPRGWVNDPNGIGRWDGRWHVFFQHNPDVPEHRDICWGHASSADLLTWRDEPVALTPRPGAIDAAGVWSGVATIEHGEPVLVYTAVPDTANTAGVALARRAPDGSWTPADDWAAPRPPDMTVRDVRDPFLFELDSRRYAIQGAGTVDGTALVLLYDASDLEHWELLGPLLTGEDPVASEAAPARIWECPQLVRLADTDGAQSWVLILSLWDDAGASTLNGVSALVGDLVPDDDGVPRFAARAGHALDDGPDFYAPQAFVDTDRVLVWGWTWESRVARTAEEVGAAGWAGALTFPRELTLRGGRVTSEPATELTGLRRAPLEVAGSSLTTAEPAWEAEAEGEVVLTLDGPSGAREVWRGAGRAARVLVDGSVVEAFLDAGEGWGAATVRAYPAPGEHWSLRATGGLTAWALGLPTP